MRDCHASGATPLMQRKLLIALLLASSVLAILQLGRGLFILGAARNQPLDFSLRWAEQIQVAGGTNPYDVSEHFYRLKLGLPPTANAPRIHSGVTGTWIGSGYPPWAFFWANGFIPPLKTGIARLWFFSCNLAALTVLAIFAGSVIPNGTPFQRSFAAVTALSASAIGTTLGNGQWGLILLALLILASRQLSRGSPLSAGALFAVSLLKPTFSFAHANGFLAGRAWQALALAGLLTAAAAGLAGWHIGTSPLVMIRQMLEQSARWKDLSYSIPDALVALNLPRTPVILGCLALAGGLSWWFAARRPQDVLFGLAVAGVLARVLAYHQLYDNVLILFLLLVLARGYFNNNRWMDLAVFATVLLTLWLPGRLTHIPAVQVAQIAIWCGGLGWMVAGEPRGERLRAGPP